MGRHHLVQHPRDAAAVENRRVLAAIGIAATFLILAHAPALAAPPTEIGRIFSPPTTAQTFLVSMIVDFSAQTAPVLWALLALLLLLALVIFASIEPELTEIFLGDFQLLVATVTRAVVAIAMISGRTDLTRDLGGLVPDR